MRGRAPPAQQAGRAESRAPVQTENKPARPRLAPDPVQEPPHPPSAPPGRSRPARAARRARSIGDLRIRLEPQALDVTHARGRLAIEAAGRVGEARQHLEGAGEIDLVHAFEEQRADVRCVSCGIMASPGRMDKASIGPRQSGRTCQSPLARKPNPAHRRDGRFPSRCSCWMSPDRFRSLHRPTIWSPRAGGPPPYRRAHRGARRQSLTASSGLVLASDAASRDRGAGRHADRCRRPRRRSRGRRRGAGRLAARPRAGRRDAPRRSAPAPTCSPPPGCSTGAAPPRTGPIATTSRGAFPPYASNPIRSSCATARSGPPPA